ncbi:Uncharacterised protein [Bordetella pertussis]|nr:Uncharacterised protein [Bordetella pertussis]
MLAMRKSMEMGRFVRDNASIERCAPLLGPDRKTTGCGAFPTPDLLRMPQRGKLPVLRRRDYPKPVRRLTAAPGHLPGGLRQLPLPLAAPQACAAKASISTSSAPRAFALRF